MKHLFALTLLATAVATASPAHAGDGTNLTTMIAEDTQIVMVFDLADARDSALLQKGWSKLLAMQPAAKDKIAELGIDPMKDIDTVLFAGGGVKDFDSMDRAGSMVVIVEGRLPTDKLSGAPDVKTTRYAGVSIWTKGDADAAMVGDRLLFTKKGKMKAALDVALNKGKGKGKNVAASRKAAKMRAAIATTDTTSDVWVTVLVPDKNKKEMAKDGVVIDSVAAGASFDADVAMKVRMNSTSEDGARKLVALIQGQLAQATTGLGQIGLTRAAKSIQVGQDGAAIVASIKITGAEIESLVNMAQAFGAGGSP